MRTPIRLGAYALGLTAVFAASLGLGSLTGPPKPSTAEPSTADSASVAHGDGHATPAGTANGNHLPAGLQVVEDGYRLAPLSAALGTSTPEPFRFRILGPDGAPVTRYATEHDKELHLIVVRRDLSGYQHVHPTLDADGTWSVPLAVNAPGQYRVLADFRPAGRADGLTLGVDVPAPGDYRPQPLPALAAPPPSTGTPSRSPVTWRRAPRRG